MAALAVPGLGHAVEGPAGTLAVPVASRPLSAGTILAATDLASAHLPSRQVYAGTAREAGDVVGMRLSRSMQAGDAFNTLALKEVRQVERNSVVTVLFRRPGIELTGQALALESGNEGKAIRILNPESKATLVATVAGPGTVTIGE